MNPTPVTAAPVQDQSDRRTEILQKFEEILTKVPDDHYYPKKLMRPLLNRYSAVDLESIYSDYTLLRKRAFENAVKSREYDVTAGPPGAGKSTLLEKMIGYNPETGANRAGVVYIDPDRAAMQQMPSYLQDRASQRRDAKAAYEHWRDASNFIAQVLLAEALVQGYKIAHGNTMSVDQSITNLQGIQNSYGYTTRLIHCTTSDAIRLQRENMRQAGGMFQVAPEDFAQKSVKFFSLLPRYVEVTSCDFYVSMDAFSTSRGCRTSFRSNSLSIFNRNLPSARRLSEKAW